MDKFGGGIHRNCSNPLSVASDLGQTMESEMGFKSRVCHQKIRTLAPSSQARIQRTSLNLSNNKMVYMRIMIVWIVQDIRMIGYSGKSYSVLGVTFMPPLVL